MICARKQMNISEEVDCWIAEEDLAWRPGLKVERYSDFLENDDGYWDFISWFLCQPFAVLDCIPVRKEVRFCGADLDEFGNDVSAFNTVDFVRESGYEFDLEAWRTREVLDKVVQIAITHSVVGDSEAKERCRERYVCLVEAEFRDRAFAIKSKLRKARSEQAEESLKEQLLRLNYCLRRCREAWRRYAGDGDDAG
ncbi:conserved hypothetical protein [uncultured Desulfatiglans sp.]|nr:conserved hypothetical protein [uncultured Desulfatiglans sp.]